MAQKHARAPLLAFHAGGLRVGYLFGFINTADAMLGYRTGELEWVGKTTAGTDDALNGVPARFAAVLIALTAPVTKRGTYAHYPDSPEPAAADLRPPRYLVAARGVFAASLLA